MLRPAIWAGGASNCASQRPRRHIDLLRDFWVGKEPARACTESKGKTERAGIWGWGFRRRRHPLRLRRGPYEETEFSCGPRGAYGCFRLMTLPEQARSPPSNENSRSLRDQLNSFPSWSIGDSHLCFLSFNKVQWISNIRFYSCKLNNQMLSLFKVIWVQIWDQKISKSNDHSQEHSVLTEEPHIQR